MYYNYQLHVMGILFQITIDTSPPQTGTVHDGLNELPDIDYQQDFHLDFHWDGFFDPESGVQYYKYIISDYCWTKQDLIASTEVHYQINDISQIFSITDQLLLFCNMRILFLFLKWGGNIGY